MPRPKEPLLTNKEIVSLLQELPGWQQQENNIIKEFHLPTFLDAISLTNHVAIASEIADHHPDISINYRTLSFVLSTHHSEGLTKKDFDLAAQIESFSKKFL